jgi:AcrR family transcriptional regulator
MSRTKEKILQKTLELFVLKGIDKTSTNLIAKESGVASGTIFVHFESKQDLINQVYMSAKNRLFEALESSINPKSTFKENVQNVARDIINHFINFPKEFYFITSIEPEIDVSSDFIEKVDIKFEGLKNYLHAGIRCGEIKNAEVNLLFDVAWSSLEAVIRHHHRKKNVRVKKIYLEMIWDLVKKD